MGEVYRARDAKLGREIAIKVLPDGIASDPFRRKRFEQEARSASALNHPNILTVHDIAEADGALYITMELVEGRTLRDLLASDEPIPIKKLLDIAVQTADGLAKAHAAGIVHRDLKPENLMISKDGFVKILDFGLAKLTEATAPNASVLPTAVAAPTEPGTVMGTAGYMSPEQASGQAVDFRSDQFSFGSILYELATGEKAFQRKTGAETLAAIIREEPEPIGQLAPRSPAPVRWLIERCLAKDPEERYVSTRDLARDLRSIRDHLSEASASGAAEAVALAPRRSRAIPVVLAGLGLLIAGYVARGLIDRRGAGVEPPSFRQLTFRRGPVWSGRFGSDGKAVIYSAAWDGKPTEVFVGSADSPVSRPFGLPGTDLMAVSSSGEIAVLLGSHLAKTYTHAGTLARMSATGGEAPRQILEDVEFADWSPDGKDLAVVHDVGGRTRLDYPIGKTLYETGGWIGDPRVSRGGDRIAFIDHPSPGDDGGSVAVVDRGGKRTSLTAVFSSTQGLAWSPDGSEIWFTAAEVGANRALYGVSLSGKRRLLARVTGAMTIHDTSTGGRVLISQGDAPNGLLCLAPGASSERDLALLDYSIATDLSADGRTVLLFESGEGGGSGSSVYVRGTDGSPAVRLGEGASVALSPDGKWALSIVHLTTEGQLVLYPTGAGQPRPFPMPGFKVIGGAFLPDGRRLLVSALEKGHRGRIYLADLESGRTTALTPEGFGDDADVGRIATDGTRFATRGSDGKSYVFGIDGGEPKAIPGVGPNDSVVDWTDEPTAVYVLRNFGPPPGRIERVEIATGRAVLWKELMPSDAAGVTFIFPSKVLPDGKAYAYSNSRVLSSLYLVEGLK
jgi:Tol biopolymer transport system component